MEACVGEGGFNKVMLSRLTDLIRMSRDLQGNMHDKGLEIMAGPGRNINSILKYC